VEAEKQKAEICPDPDGAVNKLIGDLQGIGLSGNSLEAIRRRWSGVYSTFCRIRFCDTHKTHSEILFQGRFID